MLLMWNQSYSFYVNSIVFYNKVTNKFNVKKKKKSMRKHALPFTSIFVIG